MIVGDTNEQIEQISHLRDEKLYNLDEKITKRGWREGLR